MEIIFKEEVIEVVQKRREDSISTNNPKAKPPCEKKITNVYMAKKKSIMVLEDESANLQKVKKNYIALTSLNVVEKYRLPRPSELDEGNSLKVEYGVYVVKKGDTLSVIMTKIEGDISSWQELANLNGIDEPRKLRIGKHLVFPLKRSEQSTLIKKSIYEETQKVAVGDCVHLVTEVEGFKKGESVLSKINEEDKITQSDELLTVTQHGKPKKEFVAVVEEDVENPAKGKAVSEEMIVEPPKKEKKDSSEIVAFQIKDKDGKPVTYQIFDKTRTEKKENNTTSSTKKDWKENFEDIEDKNVTLKVKATSPSLHKEEEVESEEVKLEKARSVQVSLDELEKQNLTEYLDPEYVERVRRIRDEMNGEISSTGISQEALDIAFPTNENSINLSNSIIYIGNSKYNPSIEHLLEVTEGRVPHVNDLLFDTKVGYPVTKGFKSLANGFMRTGDELACYVGYRDYQYGTGSYFKKQAEERLVGYKRLEENYEKYPWAVSIAAKRYIKHGDSMTLLKGGGQLFVNTIVGMAIGKASGGIPVAIIFSTPSNAIYGIETINLYTDRMIEHEKEVKYRYENGTLTKEYLDKLFHDIQDK